MSASFMSVSPVYMPWSFSVITRKLKTVFGFVASSYIIYWWGDWVLYKIEAAVHCWCVVGVSNVGEGPILGWVGLTGHLVTIYFSIAGYFLNRRVIGFTFCVFRIFFPCFSALDLLRPAHLSQWDGNP